MKTALLCLLLQATTLFIVTNTRSLQINTDAERRSAATQVVDLSGEGAYEVFPGSEWQFFGPVRPLAVGEGQKIVATATAALGAKSASTRAAIAVCYQARKSGLVIPIVGDSHLNVDIDSVQRQYTASGTVSPPPGVYSVGYCLVNTGREVIGRNNYVNGWAMTTD